MAQIFRHPEVEDYFATLDYNQSGSALGRDATKLYEESRAVVLTGVKIDCDRSFLATLQFDPKQKYSKKFKSIAFASTYRTDQPEVAGLLATTFGGDRAKLDYFARQVKSVNEQVTAITSKLFPGYKVLRPSITWRLTDTINENLHVDVYKEDLPDHHVRLFYNLDIVPRIWHTSHTLDHMLATSLSILGPEKVRTFTAGRICHGLNFALYKGFAEAGREGSPKHILFFEPGEVWFVDSRKVSHQIFFGRKALSTEHQIDTRSMANPSLHYFNIVEQHRKRYLAENPG